jgi:hypothetical protein
MHCDTRLKHCPPAKLVRRPYRTPHLEPLGAVVQLTESNAAGQRSDGGNQGKRS